MKKTQTKTLSDLYFTFIDSMSNVGSTARSEQSHCNFTDEDEKTAKESINYYKMQLEALQQQLKNVEEKAKESFGW